MAWGNTFGEMGKPTQGNGKMVSNGGQAYGNQEKEIAMSDNGSMAKFKDTEYISVPSDKSMKDNSNNF
jgi:hypothetical protein